MSGGGAAAAFVFLHFTHLSKEEQERQAKQIRILESEKLQQELLLQEKGAQIKVKVLSDCKI